MLFKAMHVPGVDLVSPDPGRRRGEIEGKEIRIDREVVGKVFLNLLDDLVLICFCEGLNVSLFEDIGEIDPVCLVLWLAELVLECGDRFWCGTEKSDAVEMFHAIPVLVIDPVCEIDFMAEKSRLSERGGDDGSGVLIEKEDFDARCLCDDALYVSGYGFDDIHPVVDEASFEGVGN